jgi:hypothetical protein
MRSFFTGWEFEYQLPSKFWKLIANSSSGFTPPLFAEAFPLDPAVNINGDLGASRITNHEAGLVGQFSKTGFVEVTGFSLKIQTKSDKSETLFKMLERLNITVSRV